jgi:hypothetical protein
MSQNMERGIGNWDGFPIERKCIRRSEAAVMTRTDATDARNSLEMAKAA